IEAHAGSAIAQQEGAHDRHPIGGERGKRPVEQVECVRAGAHAAGGKPRARADVRAVADRETLRVWKSQSRTRTGRMIGGCRSMSFALPRRLSSTCTRDLAAEPPVRSQAGGLANEDCAVMSVSADRQ